MGADLSEPQAFKNVSLQMTIFFCLFFRRPVFFHFSSNIFYQIAPHSSFAVGYEWSKWKRIPFTASTASASTSLILNYKHQHFKAGILADQLL